MACMLCDRDRDAACATAFGTIPIASVPHVLERPINISTEVRRAVGARSDEGLKGCPLHKPPRRNKPYLDPFPFSLSTSHHHQTSGKRPSMLWSGSETKMDVEAAIRLLEELPGQPGLVKQ